jgi:hypothetical protein
MGKKRRRREHWKNEPEEHEYPAAAAYLSLLYPESVSESIVAELRGAATTRRKAKDLLRAGRLPLLPADDAHVAEDLAEVARGERLSPVLLVRGDAARGLPLLVADGYHRICASYHLDEDADIPCCIVDRPG